MPRQHKDGLGEQSPELDCQLTKRKRLHGKWANVIGIAVLLLCDCSSHAIKRELKWEKVSNVGDLRHHEFDSVTMSFRMLDGMLRSEVGNLSQISGTGLGSYVHGVRVIGNLRMISTESSGWDGGRII